MLAACFRFCVTSSSLSSSTLVFSWATSACRAARSPCRPCTSWCLITSSCFSFRDCRFIEAEVVNILEEKDFVTVSQFALRVSWPCRPEACWSLPALLGAPWSCCWPDPAETEARYSLTVVGHSCCSASLWSPAAQLHAPCCLEHPSGGQPSDWLGFPLPLAESWSPVCPCVTQQTGDIINSDLN